MPTLDDLQRLYPSKTDDELLALASDLGALSEPAQKVLAAELAKRGLHPSPKVAGANKRLTNDPAEQFLQGLGLAATVGCAVGAIVVLMGVSWRVALPAAVGAFVLNYIISQGMLIRRRQ